MIEGEVKEVTVVTFNRAVCDIYRYDFPGIFFIQSIKLYNWVFFVIVKVFIVEQVSKSCTVAHIVTI